MDGRMSVRHTANAGVLITTKAGAVGVDLFSRDPQGLYEDTPADLQEELLEEIGKGRIGVLLFTHGHGDHFPAKGICHDTEHWHDQGTAAEYADL